MKQTVFFEGSPWKVIWQMCVPSVLTILVMMIYNMADIFFIGQLNNTMMVAGLTVATPIMSVLSALGSMIGGGACAALANAIGDKQWNKAKSLSSFAFWGAALTGLGFMLVIQLSLEPLLEFAGAKSGSMPYAKTYLRIISLGAPLMIVPTACGSLIRAEGAAKQAMLGNMLGTVTNIILDPILILLLRMDVAGAAIATVIANGISCGYYIWYLTKKTAVLTMVPQFFTLRHGIPQKVLVLGLPTAVGTLMSSASTLLSNNLLSGYSESALAARGVSSKVIMIVTMLQMGITMGIQPVLAYFYGAKNTGKLKEYLQKCALVTVIAGASLTGICLIFGPQLLGFFLDDPEVIKQGTVFIRIGILAGPIAGIQQLSTSFLQSTEKPAYALILALTRDGLVYLPLLYLLDHFYGITGYIVARPVATLACAMLGLTFILRRYRQLQQKFA